ncbi:MAG TPA: DUF502 domain-containing protein [Steroidobacteraceae bacterium]|nr:DUF502 domain-containing protein [Steroidobacteraceae bacterium]
MRKSVDFLLGTVLAGLLILAPIYLAVLLLLKATASLLQLVKPLTRLLPPLVIHENAIALLLIFLFCFLVGLLVRTRWGQAGWKRLDPVLDKIPGYSLFRGFMQRLTGDTHEEAWKPALAEIEDALVPAFIIEALADGRFTVFVPAVPAPFTGAVYILDPDRVHPVDVPFTRAIQAVSRWGSGCRDLVAAMADKKVPARKTTS